MEEEPTQSLTLTKLELLYIDDQITMGLDTDEVLVPSLRPVSSSASIIVGCEFLEKVSEALYIVFTNGEETECIIEFDYNELLLLREISLSSVRVGNEPIGISLKKKVHQALHDFHLRELVAFPFSNIEETPNKEEIQLKLLDFNSLE